MTEAVVEATTETPEAPAEAVTAEGTPPEAQETIEATTEENTTPANVDINLTAPEGMEMFADDFATFSTEAGDWMKANPDATPADAFKWAAERQASSVTDGANATIVAHNERVEGWETQVKADKDIGGDKYDQSVATALKVMDTWGSKELTKQLTVTGLGSHPDMVKLLVSAGGALEDAKILTTTGGGARKTFADSLYGNN